MVELVEPGYAHGDEGVGRGLAGVYRTKLSGRKRLRKSMQCYERSWIEPGGALGCVRRCALHPT
jgi:hypothetical protein